jgi:putative spermidine/putrescine transport system permease protein
MSAMSLFDSWSGKGEGSRVRGSIICAQLPLLWPFALLIGFFAVPFLILVRVSLANRDASAYQGTGFSLSAYGQLAQPMVTDAVLFSVALALVVATASALIAAPATYLITRMRRKAQIAWLIAFLSTLALSEVLITFAWQIMLSKRVGLSHVFVWLGFLDRPESWAPSFGAVVACLVYVVIPFNVLTLYPGMSRLDPSYLEAARTLGARPSRAFCEILLPLMRGPLTAAYIMTVVLSLGAYVAPLVLGGPQNWTIGVVISETALQGQNLPMAAAISMLLLVATALLIWIIGRVGGRGTPA